MLCWYLQNTGFTELKSKLCQLQEKATELADMFFEYVHNT